MNGRGKSSIFDGFEEKEAVLSNVEVNVVIGFISDIGAEVSANEGMPISVVFSIEFVFEMGSNLLDCMHLV